jgi:hypothetical protein
MTFWTPTWRVKANGTDVTDIALTNLSITSGRTDFNSDTLPSYCSLTLINTTNAVYNWSINTSISIEVQDSSDTYVPIFGGRISDLAIEVNSSGNTGTVTRVSITALGALTKLQRALFDGNLIEGLDGAQITQLLADLLLAAWNEVPTSLTWADYDPTETWANAGNVGLGTIDAGEYTLVSRQITDQYLAPIASSISKSALGYLYEDPQGRISYADASHRQDYLEANGYTELDGFHALGSGISAVTRQGNLLNSLTVNYGNNFNSAYTSENLTSQSNYGLYAEEFQSYLKNASDVEDFADKVIALRATPYAEFKSITFPIQNPEIDDADRDALLGVFMGLPVAINNLPANISGGSFLGFVEGWSFRASVGGLYITLNLSPAEFNTFTEAWEDVAPSLTWQTISATLTWQNAIGVIS